MSNTPFCSIVLFTHNGKELLKQYLPSIVNLDYQNREIIIVDDRSSDGTDKFIAEKYPEIKLVRVDQHLGTAECSNIGARQAKGDLIFWLHNDMYLPPDTLDNLIKKITSSEKIGICTCKVKKMTPDGKFLNIIDSIGGGIDKYGFPIARGINEEDTNQYDKTLQTFFAFGGPMLLRKKVFDLVNGMDPILFTLADDIDFCWRCRLLGYDVIVDTDTIIFHVLSGTVGSWPREIKRYFSERNTLRMLIKNFSTRMLFKILPIYIATLFFEILFFIIIGKSNLAKSDCKAFLWNIKNLKNTITERKKIQHIRKISDNEIMKHMYQKSLKIEYLKDFLSKKNDPSWKNYFNN